MGTRITSRSLHAEVNGMFVRSTIRFVHSHRNSSEELRISAPGRRPASQRIWNPLQMPHTRPPRSANSSIDSITGANRAIAPVRR